jgi:hypothetical protein
MHVTALGAGQATIEVDLEPKVEEIDLAAGADLPVASPAARISATLAGFHHLHLPARAMWHERQCVMPELASATAAHAPRPRPGEADDRSRSGKLEDGVGLDRTHRERVASTDSGRRDSDRRPSHPRVQRRKIAGERGQTLFTIFRIMRSG